MDANCGNLDAPRDRCSQPLTVTAGAVDEVHVTIRAGKACTFDEEPTTTPA